MKKMIFSYEGIVLMSVFPALLFGLILFSQPQSKNAKKTEVMHTFLIKIPSSAGVCPYELMKASNGKLQMIHDPNCVCPYEKQNSSYSNAFYMTAISSDINTARALLPASIRSIVEIKLTDSPHTVKKTLPKLYTNIEN